MGNILEIKDLSKNFKGLKAVDSVSACCGGGRHYRAYRFQRSRKDNGIQYDKRRVPRLRPAILSIKNKEITGMKPYHYTSMELPGHSGS